MSEDLWQRWAQSYKDVQIDPARICKDGIVNPALFREASVRVLFVMREANKWEGGDIRSLLLHGPKYQLWHTIGRWGAGLLSGFPPYETIDSHGEISNALKRVASINLKKVSGGSKSDCSVINAYAAQDQDLLREQISEIDPTVIVACGTFDPLVWLLQIETDPERPRGIASLSATGVRVIPWRHPVRAKNRTSYDDLRRIAEGGPDKDGIHAYAQLSE